MANQIIILLHVKYKPTITSNTTVYNTITMRYTHSTHEELQSLIIAVTTEAVHELLLNTGDKEATLIPTHSGGCYTRTRSD